MAEKEQGKFDNIVYQKDYYQKNAELMKEKRRKRYRQGKKTTKKNKLELEHSLYTAESIKVLMSWGEYTDCSREKKKQWADFVWTLQDIARNINFADITQIQRLELLAGNLARDYHATAKNRSGKLESDWKILTEKEQKRLVKYWALEKVRNEKALADKIEEFVKLGESYEKDIELMKFHEERGKVKCECWKCQEEKKVRGEIKERFGKIYQEPEKEKLKCGECKKFVSVKQWNEEAGACKGCVKRLNEQYNN